MCGSLEFQVIRGLEAGGNLLLRVDTVQFIDAIFELNNLLILSNHQYKKNTIEF